MSDEREDWDALIKSPGWLRLIAFAKAQWGGVNYKARVDQAISKAEADRSDVGTAVKIISAVANEVNVILSYPHERITTLEKSVDVHLQTPSRRGGM